MIQGYLALIEGLGQNLRGRTPRKRFFMMKIVLGLAVIHLLHAAQPFPEDLMYKGEPIHPMQILHTQIGDGSRFEPQSVGYDSDFITPVSCSFDPETNWVEAKGFFLRGKEPCYVYDAYKYIGSYNGKHLIEAYNHGDDCRMRSAHLSLVRRVGDTIVNAGEIACGDRGYGGVIFIKSLEGNHLSYEQCATPEMAIQALCHQEYKEYPDKEDYYPPYWAYYNLYLSYAVDLDDLEPRLTGLRFDYELGNIKERCPEWRFFDVMAEYINAGKKELTLEEGRQFAWKVME